MGGNRDERQQRTSYSASFRHRFCKTSFVAKPSYIYDRNRGKYNKGQRPNLFCSKEEQATHVFKVVEDGKV